MQSVYALINSGTWLSRPLTQSGATKQINSTTTEDRPSTGSVEILASFELQ